ncbi:glutathione metabolism protein [Pseudomonas sp. SDI]|uniref:MAPEG family protein n=1 Tax=Pseudomonas sp. SDI TaxID=2170734 RepID=UPI000DE61ABD|nr:MAPEG family protein [Pseudomonas sp. SDI]PWB32891.1 glutathione metabolism protein [Pseudomonas sp. SDI]
MSSLLALYVLCVLVLFVKMFAISCYQGFFRLRHRAFSNPEDAGFLHGIAREQELPPVRRAARAWANDLENIPLFWVLGGVCVLLNTSQVATAWMFCGFTLARLLHTLMYLGGWQPWRTIAYAVGVVCLFGLAGLLGAAALMN